MDTYKSIVDEYIKLYDDIANDLSVLANKVRIKPLDRAIGESEDENDSNPFKEKMKSRWIADVGEFLAKLEAARNGHKARRNLLVNKANAINVVENKILSEDVLVNLNLEIKSLIKDINHIADGFLSKKDIIKEISNGMDDKLEKVSLMTFEDYMSDDFLKESVDRFGIPLL